MISRSLLYNKVIKLDERELSTQNFKDYSFADDLLPVEVDVIYENRPDLLAYSIYGNSEYWWLLFKLNGIEDIWNDYRPGMIIMTPSPADMDKLLKHLTVGAHDVAG